MVFVGGRQSVKDHGQESDLVTGSSLVTFEGPVPGKL